MPEYRETTVESWNAAIEDALEFRRKYGREAQWAKCESLYYHANELQSKNVGPNIIASTGDALLSTLLVPNPYFVLKALKMDTIHATPVLESVLNTLMYSLKLKAVAQDVVLHAFLYGRGIIKFGYDSEFGYDPDEDIGQTTNQILGITLTQFNKKGARIEFNDGTPGMPWARAVLPHDFLVPYGTKEISDAPWCAHRIVRHIDDIKADPKYSNKKDLVPTLSMSDFVQSYLTVMKPYRMGMEWGAQNRESGDKSEFVEMWEIHDARTGRVYVIAQGHEKFLRNEIDYLQEDGLPFASVGFVPSSRTFWTTPDAVYLQSSQEEAIDIATMQRIQRRMSTLRFLYEEGTITSDELEKFMSGEIGVGIKYSKGSAQTPVMAITPSNNNAVLQQEAEYIRRDARETVGFSRNQLGEYEASGRRTASEAMIVKENSDQRMNRRQSALADLFSEVGKKLSKIVFKFWRTPRVIEIIGPDGAAQWSSFEGSALKGEYMYRIGFTNEPLQGLQSRKADAISLFSSLAADPTIDQLALRRYLVRAFNDPDFTSLFLPGVVNNANLRLPVSGMQENMGGNPSNGGDGNSPPMPGKAVSGDGKVRVSSGSGED